MNKRLVTSLLIFVVYLFIIILGPRIQLGNQNIGLNELLSRQVVVSLVLAASFLVAAIMFLGWRRSVGLMPPRTGKSLLVAWFPLLTIAIFFAGAISLGIADPSVVAFVCINTLFVGIGEELAFRGFVFEGAASVLGLPKAILACCLVFGGVHVLNGFLTGDFIASTIQAVSAGMSGLVFIALLLRTGSIIPSIIVHWLWDFGLIMLTTSSSAAGPVVSRSTTEISTAGFVAPIMIVVPNFLYALWLLRGISKHTKKELVG